METQLRKYTVGKAGVKAKEVAYCSKVKYTCFFLFAMLHLEIALNVCGLPSSLVKSPILLPGSIISGKDVAQKQPRIYALQCRVRKRRRGRINLALLRQSYPLLFPVRDMRVPIQCMEIV